MMNKLRGMFSSNGSASSEATIISPNAKINGTIEVDGDLDIWGNVSTGKNAQPDDLAVKATGGVVVNTNASVSGAIQGKRIALLGVNLGRSPMFYEESMELDNSRTSSIIPRPFDASKNDTTIPANSKVSISEGSHVDGSVEGHTIEVKGAVEGNITGHNVTIEGSVVGDIKAHGILRFSAKAIVRGSVDAGSIEVALGAKIDGTMRLGVLNEIKTGSSSQTKANIRNVSSPAELKAEA